MSQAREVSKFHPRKGAPMPETHPWNRKMEAQRQAGVKRVARERFVCPECGNPDCVAGECSSKWDR